MNVLQPARHGSIVVLSSVLMIVMLAMMAFAFDLGYVMMEDAELQRTADSAAMAATWELIDNDTLSGDGNLTQEISQARDKAQAYSWINRVGDINPIVDLNEDNDASGDVVVGYIANPSAANKVLAFDTPDSYNAVTVRVRRKPELNGEVPLFFAKLLGQTGVSLEAEATAMLVKNFRGFTAPPNGENLGALPFALDVDTWNDMLEGGGDDSWEWDAATETISSGSDGIREINLYPMGDGPPGNRGTVDIGPSGNSTNDIARQIVDGVTQEELDYIGGSLELGPDGTLSLNGDTGISAGVKDELESIKGKPRIIPLFSEVSGPGNNAYYTIVAFVGVRILDVRLTGKMSSKRVIIQPAHIVAKGGIPNTDNTQTSSFIYSPVWLVR